MLQLLQMEFVGAIQAVVMGIGATLPKLLAALLFIILGWIFGAALGRIVHQIVAALKVNELLAKAGVDGFFARAGYRLDAPAFFGWLAKLFIIIIFLIAAFDILGLSQVNIFLSQVLAYIPQVVVAAVILFIASVAADILSGMVAGATKAVGSHVAHMLAAVTRWAIWMFAFIIALSQLGIAPQYMYTIFAGLIAMLALAGGLAFGLGGKEAAAQMIKELQQEIKQGK